MNVHTFQTFIILSYNWTNQWLFRKLQYNISAFKWSKLVNNALCIEGCIYVVNYSVCEALSIYDYVKKFVIYKYRYIIMQK